MVLMNPNNNHSLYKLDLNYGQVVEEWVRGLSIIFLFLFLFISFSLSFLPWLFLFSFLF